MDAFEDPAAHVPPDQRCTQRLKNHSRCKREAAPGLNGMCRRCHTIAETKRLEAPRRKVEAKLRQMQRAEPRKILAIRAVIREAEANGLEAHHVEWLYRRFEGRWAAMYFDEIDHVWTGGVAGGLPLDTIAANANLAIDALVDEMVPIEPLDPTFVHRLRHYVLHLQQRQVNFNEFHHRFGPEQELGRLAADRQNVHTAAVSKQMAAGLAILVAADPGPPPKGETDTRTKIMSAFCSVLGADPWSDNMTAVGRDMVLTWNRSRQSRSEINPINYHTALRGLWAKINTYTGDIHKELIQRLWEECLESVGMCTMGHLARLTNVMVGYDDGFKQEEPIGEKIQRRMAEIAGMDVEYDEQIRLATEFLEEHEVEAEKQREWLSAF
jgi:hypothetical protein